MTTNRPHHHYTDYEKEWLLSQDSSMTYAELTDAFNKHFGLNVTTSSVKDLMIKRLRVISRSHNSRRTQFSKGAKPKFSVGDEIVKDKYIYVKVNDKYVEGRYTSEDYANNWKRKSDIVWEASKGKIPDGWFVVFLDNNPLNCDISNLVIVNRSLHSVMCKNRFYSTTPEVTVTGLKICELIFAIKDARERIRHEKRTAYTI